jgi:hypothetical protein
VTVFNVLKLYYTLKAKDILVLLTVTGGSEGLTE